MSQSLRGVHVITQEHADTMSAQTCKQMRDMPNIQQKRAVISVTGNEQWAQHLHKLSCPTV